jgi:tRNA/rRNA methyltransferase
MKFAVILVGPKNPENIGLVARNMKNTGFEELRLVGVTGVDQKLPKKYWKEPDFILA